MWPTEYRYDVDWRINRQGMRRLSPAVHLRGRIAIVRTDLRANAFADYGDLRADDAFPDEAPDLRAITSSERASDRRADRVPRRPYHGSMRRLRIH